MIIHRTMSDKKGLDKFFTIYSCSTFLSGFNHTYDFLQEPRSNKMKNLMWKLSGVVHLKKMFAPASIGVVCIFSEKLMCHILLRKSISN